MMQDLVDKLARELLEGDEGAGRWDVAGDAKRQAYRAAADKVCRTPTVRGLALHVRCGGGDRVELPRNVEHARAMLLVASQYLEQHRELVAELEAESDRDAVDAALWEDL